jgi:ribosome maturation factor RimP
MATMSAILRERLIALIEPLVGRLGYELVELEQSSGHGSAVVRIFIDRLPAGSAGAEPDSAPASGVGLDDCERVSREVSALLDVEDPIPTAYTLEVSSPGSDRVLRTRAHFARFVGSRVHVELCAPRDGRRRYTGKLLSAEEAGIALEVDGQRVPVSFAEIGKARLIG